MLSEQKSYFIKIIYLLPLLLIALILVSSILEPYLEYKRCQVAESIFRTLHVICHQAPSKSIWIGNYTIAICARCFALYSSLLITGIWIYVKNYKRTRWFIGLLLILPMVIDGLTQWHGLRVSNNGLRLITGAFGGAGLGLLFYPSYIKLISFLKAKMRKEVNRPTAAS